MVEKRFNKLGMPDIERFENYLPTAFNSELTLLQKVNKIIFDLIETNELTNEMVEYLNRFIESFDDKLYETIDDVLTKWLEDGILSEVIRNNINEEVVKARTDYLGKKYVDLKERLDSEKADIVEVTKQVAQKVSKGEVSVNDINKNLGKLDQTYMSDEFLQQVTGNASINAVPADDSVTTKKLANKSVASVKLDSFLAKMLYGADNLNSVPTDLQPGTFYSSNGELITNGDTLIQSTGRIPVKPGLKYTADNIYLNQQTPGRTSAITWFGKAGNFISATRTDEVIAQGYGIAPYASAFARFIYYTDISNSVFVCEYDKALNNKIHSVEDRFLVKDSNLIGTITLNKAIFADGSISDSTTYCLIDYIPVTPGEKYCSNHRMVNPAFYDKDKVYISSVPSVLRGDSVTVPKGASFIQFSADYADIGGVEYVSLITFGRESGLFEMPGLSVNKNQLTFDIDSTTKKPYTSGNIYFSVDVNQNFADIESITNTVNDSETFASVPCVLKLPITYTATGKPTKLVMCAHGAGSYVTSSSAPNFERWNGLVDNGYAVFDVNGSGSSTTTGQHVSGVRALEGYFKAYQYLIEQYNFEPTILVTGASMGGITALNFANRFEHIVDSIGVLYPVTDLYTQGWLNPWSGDTKQRIAEEYNFDDKTGNTFEKDKVIGLNPINNNSFDMNGTGYSLYPKPLKIWHGTADTVVPIDKTKELVQKIKNMGGQVDLRIIDGVGHTQPDIFIDELVLYFNRFVNKS